MNLAGRKITVHDMCLRDGMHPKQHKITVEEMVRVAQAMDDAGVPLIEVTHGDGLGGASVNYGFPAATDEEYLRAVCGSVKNTGVSALLLPGIGTVDHLQMAVDCGIHSIRVATHCTEADVAEQHIGMASQIEGLDTVGFLMMAHMIEPEELLAQMQLMESYGANCVYITDSAGYMLPDDVSACVALARRELTPSTELGFHGHHNLAMGVANSIAAVAAGANRIDGSMAGLGAGAGNTPLEVFIAVCDRMGIETGVDTFKAVTVRSCRYFGPEVAAARRSVRPVPDRACGSASVRANRVAMRFQCPTPFPTLAITPLRSASIAIWQTLRTAPYRHDRTVTQGHGYRRRPDHADDG